MEFAADVIVVGAGPAGVAATLSAAEEGADCLLIEASSRPGGTVASAGIFSLCGVFPQHSSGKFPFPSPWNELSDNRRISLGKMDVLQITPWGFSSLLERFVSSLPNISLAMSTPVCPGMKFSAGALIDCTGDAILAGLAGVETLENPACSPGLGFVLKGVDMDCLAPGALDITRKASAEFPDVSIRLFPALAFEFDAERLVPGMLNLSSKHALLPPALLYDRAVKQLDAILGFLGEKAGALSNAAIFWKGERVGARSGRVIRGRKMLEFKDCADAHNAVACGFWPSELWQDASGAEFSYLSGGILHIPDECLEAEFAIPFFAAGRCLCADPVSQASVRVTGTAISTGIQAGLLAARAAQQGGRRSVRL